MAGNRWDPRVWWKYGTEWYCYWGSTGVSHNGYCPIRNKEGLGTSASRRDIPVFDIDKETLSTADWRGVRYQVGAIGEGGIAYSARIELDPAPIAAENFAERGVITVERKADLPYGSIAVGMTGRNHWNE